MLRLNDDLQIDVKIKNPDEFVGNVKRYNRTLQETFRKVFYCSLFCAIPIIFMENLAKATT